MQIDPVAFKLMCFVEEADWKHEVATSSEALLIFFHDLPPLEIPIVLAQNRPEAASSLKDFDETGTQLDIIERKDSMDTKACYREGMK